jgi:hypothetical protein
MGVTMAVFALLQKRLNILSSTRLLRISGRWYVFKLGDEKKFFPVVLTTGPEEILCSGRVGSSRAPIRGPLPLLGSATGSQGSLRRMCLKNLPVKIQKS